MKAIRVPVIEKSKVSKGQFLAALTKAFQPLLRFNPWLHIQISDDDGGNRCLDGSRGVEATGDDAESGWYVCTIHWDQKTEEDDWDNNDTLYSGDFTGENPRAIEVFRQIFEDLGRHENVPEIPDKLKKALACLK